MDEGLEVVARHWSVRRSSDGSRWWMHPSIHRHINRIVCGEEIEGPHQGFNRLIRERMPDGGFRRGLSIGCGSGGKEMKLLAQNVVQSFDLFEIGEGRRAQIEAKAAEHGVSDRITIHIGDAFDCEPSAEFDLIYWNNALHHMLDVRQALAWCDRALRKGGHFVMDDFVGPTRFQWPDEDLELATRIRSLLPERFLISPRNPAVQIDRDVVRPSIDHMMRTDPSEAADSSRILEVVREFFPDAEVIATGGVVYHLALSDVLANFTEDDEALLQSFLLLDECLAKNGRTQYAVVLAEKPSDGTQTLSSNHSFTAFLGRSVSRLTGWGRQISG